MQLKFHTESPEATFNFGKKIGTILTHGTIVGLDGPLGAGKTWLAKGIVQGIGAYDPSLVTSPTYTLVNEYTLNCDVFHIDFYRLDSLSLLDELFFLEILERTDVITLVEWAEKFLPDLVSGYLSINLTNTGLNNYREITVTAKGSARRYVDMLNDIAREEHSHN